MYGSADAVRLPARFSQTRARGISSCRDLVPASMSFVPEAKVWIVAARLTQSDYDRSRSSRTMQFWARSNTSSGIGPSRSTETMSWFSKTNGRMRSS